MEFLKVTKELAADVGRIYAQSWKAAYQGIVPQAYLDSLLGDRWAVRLQNSLYEDFVLKVDHELVATASITPAREESMAGWGEIISLYVLPQYFSKGYGSKLFSYAVEQLQKKGFDHIYLWVLEENKQARAFYEQQGFVYSGESAIITIGGKELTELRYINKKTVD